MTIDLNVERFRERDADLINWELAHLHFADAEAEELQIIREVRPYTMTTPSRILALLNAVKYVVRGAIDGDFVECGVWRGGSSMAIAIMLQRLNDLHRSIYMYDTFNGMPTPSEVDNNLWGESAMARHKEFGGNQAGSDWAFASYEDVKNNMDIVGLAEERVRLIRGPVEETLPSQAPECISLLRLDSDWYKSTRHELEHLFPRVSTGGVVLIDDYGHWNGARKAVDEYLSAHSIYPYLHRIDYAARLWVVD